MEELYKVGDKVPKAGRYQCLVCGLVIEFMQKHIDNGAVFNSCPLCYAGTEKGPKKPDEDIWKNIG